MYGFVGNNPEGYFDGLGLSALSPENLASCIYITPHAKLKDTFGAGWSIYPWFFAHRLVVKHSFFINIRAHWKPGNSYAKDSRCTCRMVKDEYVKAQYPYAIYASAKVITDGDENPVVYNMSGHEQITLYGRFQKDEISMANILAGKETLGTISPGTADFSIKGRFLKKYNEVEVMAYVENPGKSPITIYKQIYSYKYSDSDVPWFKSYRWFKLPAQID